MEITISIPMGINACKLELINVPQNAKEFRVEWLHEYGSRLCYSKIIPIPQPKKVKKYFWVIQTGNSVDIYNARLRSEQEIKTECPGGIWYEPIQHTMVEVEECN